MEEKEISAKFKSIDFDKTLHIQYKVRNRLIAKQTIPLVRRLAWAGGISALILCAVMISHKTYFKLQAGDSKVKQPGYKEMLAYNNINKYPYYKLLGEEK